MGGLNQFNGLSNMPIEGTIPIDLSIENFIPFIRLAGQVVSGGNGIYNLLMMADNKKFDIIQMVPYSKYAVLGHSSLGFQSPTHPEVGNAIVCAFQYAAPELCLNTRLWEYLLPYDGDEIELMRLARIVANKENDDDSCIRRVGASGKPYVMEHQPWLADLRACEN